MRSRRTLPTRSGVAIGVSVAIIAIVFVIAFSYFTLMRGVGTGLEAADGHIRALAIAESGTHMLIARVFGDTWEARWFKDQPFIQDTPIAFGGGSFIYVIQNTPGVPLSFDLWVRSDYHGKRRLLFYRIAYEDSVFHGLVTPTVDFTSTLAEGTGSVPLSGASLDPLTRQVNSWIEQRKLTSGELGEARQRMNIKVDPLAILRDLGAAMPGAQIQAVASAPPGVSTVVQPPQSSPVPAGGQSTVSNVDRNRIFDWLNKRGYESEYLAALKSRANSEFSKIDRATREMKFLEAETILRNLMAYLYGRTGLVNTQVKLENVRYMDAVQAMEAKAAAEAWVPDQVSAARLELDRDHRARLQQIYQTNWTPSS